MKKGTKFYLWRFLLSIAIDIVDFLISFIPGLETITDIFSLIISMAIWGPDGLLGLLEVVEITGIADKFIPTVTLSGIIHLIRMKGDKK